MSDDHQGDEIHQHSTESRQQLRARADALAAALEQHTAALLELEGGTSSLPRLFQLNDEVRRAAAAWDDAAFAHTGTFPISVEAPDDEEEDDDNEEYDGVEEPVGSAESPLAVSVVSRWDLDIIDPAALVEAGRAAHRRMNPSESEADAAVAIGDTVVGQALYAVVHEHGEPWFEIAGVGLVRGQRVYLHRDEDQPALDEVEQYEEDLPFAPAGTVLFGETW